MIDTFGLISVRNPTRRIVAGMWNDLSLIVTLRCLIWAVGRMEAFTEVGGRYLHCSFSKCNELLPQNYFFERSPCSERRFRNTLSLIPEALSKKLKLFRSFEYDLALSELYLHGYVTQIIQS